MRALLAEDLRVDLPAIQALLSSRAAEPATVAPESRKGFLRSGALAALPSLALEEIRRAGRQQIGDLLDRGGRSADRAANGSGGDRGCLHFRRA